MRIETVCSIMSDLKWSFDDSNDDGYIYVIDKNENVIGSSQANVKGAFFDACKQQKISIEDV